MFCLTLEAKLMLNIRLGSSGFYSSLRFTGDSAKEPDETPFERLKRLQKEGKKINGLDDKTRDPKPKVFGIDRYTPTSAGDRLRADLNKQRGNR